MLHIDRLLAAKPKKSGGAELQTLLTPWGETLDEEHVLEEHPSPQFARPSHAVLNGAWRCAFVRSGHDPAGDLISVVAAAPRPADEAFDREIVVPFSPEAPLSGTSRTLQPDELLWYRRAFPTPSRAEGARVLLHFQAVDYACAVRVNGRLLGTHEGGYLPFSFDATDALRADGGNALEVCVADPSELGGQPRGKQRLDRGGIWYTAQSGIWQTVWLEVVPAAHIVSAKIEPDARTGILAVGLRLESGGRAGGPGSAGPGAEKVFLEVLDGDEAIAAQSCAAESTCALAVHIPDAHLWSPDDPHLYTLRMRFGDDEVMSYCGFRTVEVRDDDRGRARVFLNGRPVFLRGALDQGYWPDGLLTAPADDALVFDIEAMRRIGFNLMRKHIKIESARWYYHCDRMGMLVWQDMVSGGDDGAGKWETSYKPSIFRASWDKTRDTAPATARKLGAGGERYRRAWLDTCFGAIDELGNHPCIIGWTLFNEGWGQFCSEEVCEAVRALDPTRPVCATSGWYDQGAGDVRGIHNYFRDLAVWKKGLRGRAFLITEFGGYAHRVDGHSAPREAYGYAVFDTAAEWRERTSALLAKAKGLAAEGLAGFVLTQLSDVEDELNGILTYDRKVAKGGRL